MTTPTEADRNARVEEIRIDKAAVHDSAAILEETGGYNDAYAAKQLRHLLSENARLAAERDRLKAERGEREKALVKFVYRTIPGLWEINDVAAASVIEAFDGAFDRSHHD